MIALELLKTRKNRKCDIGQTLAERLKVWPMAPAQSHPFVAYATDYYMYHILGVWNSDGRMGQLWQCILDNKSLPLRIAGWLQYELQQRRVTGLDGKFVPWDVLCELLKYDIVRKVLEETGYNEYDISELAHSILKDHLRGFALLVDIGMVDEMRGHFRSFMTDRELPVSSVQFLAQFKPKLTQSTASPTTQPGSRQASTGQSSGSLESGRWEKLADLFCLGQREFLAPLFLEGKHYDSEERAMPFWPTEITFYNRDDESQLVPVHPAHFPAAYRNMESADGGCWVALRPLHRYAINNADEFLISGGPKVGPAHLLQAIASYRPRGDGRHHRLIFPYSGANLEDLWRQSLGPVQVALRWSLTQMAGLAEALAEVIQHDPERGFISLRQITPCNIQWFKHTTFESQAWGTLYLDIRTLMIGQNKTAVRQSEEAYRDPHEDHIRKVRPFELGEGKQCVWSLGCIYLELLIWAMMGATNLQRFREARGGANTPFYAKISPDASKLVDPSRSDRYGRFELSPEVCRWAETLLNEPDLPLAIRHIIDYLRGNVLVVDPSIRVSAHTLASDLKDLRILSLGLELPEKRHTYQRMKEITG